MRDISESEIKQDQTVKTEKNGNTENRETARKVIDAGDKFSEVYVKCSLGKCEDRDVKGMYKKARAGEIKNFTGIDDPYEAPDNADLTIETDNESLDDSANNIINYLKAKNLL